MKKQNAVASSFSPLTRMWCSDPLARFFWRLGLGPLHLSLIAFLYVVLYMFALPVYFGQFASVLKDWPTMISLGIVLPLLYAFYYWQSLTIQVVFNGLMERILMKGFSVERITNLFHP